MSCVQIYDPFYLLLIFAGSYPTTNKAPSNVLYLEKSPLVTLLGPKVCASQGSEHSL